MSVAFGGLGIMSARGPLALLSLHTLFSLVELRSMFLATFLLAAVVLLAYWTNPSEASFRAFLTEQSFRQHLSRLDDTQDERFGDSDDIYSYSRRGLSTISKRRGPSSSPLRFASGASVSLRSPKHIFHSFGLLTIAAVSPYAHHRDHSAISRGGLQFYSSVVNDYWFIGAFGRWWWGASKDGWWRDSFATSKDEEGFAGILDVKSLDRNEPHALSCNGQSPPHSTKPKLRERSTSQNINGHGRNSSPPPLPKSASLPLHAKHVPHVVSQQQHIDPPTSETRNSSVSVVFSPSTNVNPLDQSPAIAEVLKQLSASKSGLTELQAQLSDFKTKATESRQRLESDLEDQRQKKRQADTSRSELKSRTRNLEDSKRHAEGKKREAEKRLKAAEAAKASASARIDDLRRGIKEMRDVTAANVELVAANNQDTTVVTAELQAEIELRKKEIKIAETVVFELGQRARDLEEKIASERIRLVKAREEAEIRRQDRSFAHFQSVGPQMSPWPPAGDLSGGLAENIHAFHGYQVPTVVQDVPSALVKPRYSPAHRKSSFSIADPCISTRSKGYSIFDEDIASVTQALNQPTAPPSFAPFQDQELLAQPMQYSEPLSAVGPLLIPSSLIQSLEMENANASYPPVPFPASPDEYLDRERMAIYNSSQPCFGQITGSHASAPLSPVSPVDRDPFEGRPQITNHSNRSRASFSSRFASSEVLCAEPHPGLETEQDRPLPNNGTRTSFSKRNGLNPDAKEFSLSKDKLAAILSRTRTNKPPSISFDSAPARPQNVFPTLGVFAPSPAEREALTKALHGKASASLERLPCLSDVGSLPASPNPVHSVIPNHKSQSSVSSLTSGRSPWPLFSGSFGLPRLKTTFSPFADEDVTNDSASMGSQKTEGV